MLTISSKVALADHYAVSLTAVQRWTGRVDFPGGKSGPWSPPLVDVWLRSIGSPAAPVGEPGAARLSPADLAAAELRRLRERCEQLEADHRARVAALAVFQGTTNRLLACMSFPAEVSRLLNPALENAARAAWSAAIEQHRAEFATALHRLTATAPSMESAR